MKYKTGNIHKSICLEVIIIYFIKYYKVINQI